MRVEICRALARVGEADLAAQGVEARGVALAAARGIGLVDVAIAGLAAQPAVGSVIAGATKPEQVRANVATLAWEPSAEDLAELDRIAPSARP